MNLLIEIITAWLSRGIRTWRGKLGLGVIILGTLAVVAFVNPLRKSDRRLDDRSNPPLNAVLHPGDVNYPHLAISPNQVVQFTALVPDGLSPDFHLVYNVNWSQDERNPQLFTSPPGCAWRQESQFYVDIPLTLKRTGDRYTGSFSPDVFEPGPCGWHLIDLTSPNVRSAVMFFGHSLHPNGHPLPDLDLTRETVHIWCTRNGKDQPRQSSVPNELIDCTPFQMIELFTKLPPSFGASVPAEQKEWDIHATQYLTSLIVQFHDLDTLIPAYVEAHRADAHVAQ